MILKLLINVVRREQAEAYEAFYRKNGINTLFSTLCKGTASKNVLDFLGLEATKKVMLQSIVTEDEAKTLLSGMEHTMGISVPGNGIAMTVPLNAVGGRTTLQYLTDSREIQNEVNSMNENNHPFSLITVIAEKGSTDDIMDAARSVGARGGTVIPAKGTGTNFTAKFFGLTIAHEKELIYIACKAEDRDTIMRTINEKCGIQTKHHAAAFSVPVEKVVGLSALTQN